MTAARFDGVAIVCAWSSPFARWQGPLAEVDSVELAAAVTRRALDTRGVHLAALTGLVAGMTVPQQGSFYAPTTLAGRIGAPWLPGAMVSQACATGVATLAAAAAQVQASGAGVWLVVTTDRTSNGPVLTFPRPTAPGGAPHHEHWVIDNFRRDPWAGGAMIDTAEAVAAEHGIPRDELDEITLLRYEQYDEAVAAGFQAAYLVPAELAGRHGPQVVDADVGVHPTTAEGLARLDPLTPGGVVTYGNQTHPADGCAGMVVAGEEEARRLSPGVIARVLAVGTTRAERGRMPEAPVPAALRALDRAGLTMAAVDAVTTHAPFAVNDAYFARATGWPIDKMNLGGTSLVYGHPQAATGTRLIAELIEVLRQRGGGIGLFTGCAAGDTGAAVVIEVTD